MAQSTSNNSLAMAKLILDQKLAEDRLKLNQRYVQATRVPVWRDIIKTIMEHILRGSFERMENLLKPEEGFNTLTTILDNKRRPNWNIGNKLNPFSNRALFHKLSGAEQDRVLTYIGQKIVRSASQRGGQEYKDEYASSCRVLQNLYTGKYKSVGLGAGDFVTARGIIDEITREKGVSSDSRPGLIPLNHLNGVCWLRSSLVVMGRRDETHPIIHDSSNQAPSNFLVATSLYVLRHDDEPQRLLMRQLNAVERDLAIVRPLSTVTSHRQFAIAALGETARPPVVIPSSSSSMTKPDMKVELKKLWSQYLSHVGRLSDDFQGPTGRAIALQILQVLIHKSNVFSSRVEKEQIRDWDNLSVELTCKTLSAINDSFGTWPTNRDLFQGLFSPEKRQVLTNLDSKIKELSSTASFSQFFNSCYTKLLDMHTQLKNVRTAKHLAIAYEQIRTYGIAKRLGKYGFDWLVSAWFMLAEGAGKFTKSDPAGAGLFETTTLYLFEKGRGPTVDLVSKQNLSTILDPWRANTQAQASRSPFKWSTR